MPFFAGWRTAFGSLARTDASDMKPEGHYTPKPDYSDKHIRQTKQEGHREAKPNLDPKPLSLSLSL